ncbi:aminomethyl-transferring glycine dehydrogenase subunit GcvPB [Facklamia sp. DSM 111018]|uniref:Probable glycine dehydrogenase (decarboxylating) subunit 2 n=1 Tax=Facklamia lactis TaxID=2749967 RepID=A0ABS0LRK0_9LACT|nr:aminomethyl-transferring glycine dehydrogenase subunit GcvPB [Facklamia lactis]MBG9980863.1 aminomethyl-transferring glycine dehydrogenase subunit GcvPB [Facklamia lactis]MBG9986774.1 aminomethyl-transferring glycine dehydrogenase subunit GcvPB [Facklamia lactis]
MILQDYDKLIFEISSQGHTGYDMPKSEVEEYDLDAELGEYSRKEPARLPEVSELQILRHYTQLSNRNFGVESGPYPLGSCTMKYNPKVNENIAAMDGFANIHPLQDPETAQGALQLMYELQESLQEITQLDTITLQPAAGAQGELAAILAFKAYFESIGELEQRRVILIPDSAHGTNPATAMVAGFETIELPSTPEGIIDVEAVRAAVGPDTAGIMITNPSTAGLFERDAKEIVDIVHEAGGLAYYDGANLNAIMGITSPGAMGFDACHLNLHKTFTGPHGGGGPGSGPIGVVEKLAPFLPGPNVAKEGDKYVFVMPEKSFGRVKGNYGNFGVNVRAYSYIRAMGPDGLRRASEDAVLNANYLRVLVKDHFDAPFESFNKNDFVLNLTRHKKEYGVNAKDVGKRMLDYGVHAPTTYFPLIVEECLMVEPTETESKRDLDYVADVLIKIAQEAVENPELVQSAPHNTPVRRLDEAAASRKPVLKFAFEEHATKPEGLQE